MTEYINESIIHISTLDNCVYISSVLFIEITNHTQILIWMEKIQKMQFVCVCLWSAV